MGLFLFYSLTGWIVNALGVDDAIGAGDDHRSGGDDVGDHQRAGAERWRPSRRWWRAGGRRGADAGRDVSARDGACGDEGIDSVGACDAPAAIAAGPARPHGAGVEVLVGGVVGAALRRGEG